MPTAMSDASSDRGQYIVVARRYRPQGFGDLVGQGMVSQALSNAIQSDRVGHAYLFTGARGVGKTSTARILSKALNCEQGPTDSPCHSCDICQSIASGDDVDVLEIDGASNRGIDEIRQLRSNVSVRPSRSRFKIYIIDEVHMLTKEAFNALLKTLEEPPEHVKFIFCTTDPEKIPITVLSRCQRFDFAPVSTDEIVDRLRFIVESENAEADLDALKLLARKAAGSVRDSQSLLEQLLSFTTGRITAESVHAMLGTAGTEKLHHLVQALATHDAAEALKALDAAVGDGVDAGQLAEQLLGCFRDLLALSVGGDSDLLLHSSDNDEELLRGVASQWGTPNLLAAAQILDQTLARMRLVTYSRTLLEAALIRIATLENLDDLADLIGQLQSGGEPIKKKSQSPVTRASSTGQRDLRAEMGESTAVDALPKGAPPSQATPSIPSVTEAPAAVESQPEVRAEPTENQEPLEDALQIWRETIDQLEGMAADCASHFTVAANLAPNRLVVTFPARYTSSKSFCERPERHGEMEKIASRIAGRKVKLEFAVRADTAHQVPAKPVISTRQREREVTQRPYVQQAAELFSANVTGVSLPKQNEESQ